MAREDIDTELLRTLFQQGKTVIVAAATVLAVLTYSLWELVPRATLLTWLLVMLVLLAFRAGVLIIILRQKLDAGNITAWGLVWTLSTLVISTAWGSSAVYLIDPSEPATVVVIAVIIFGLGAGAIVSFASHMPAFYSVVVPIMTPLILASLWRSDKVSNVVAPLAVIALLAFIQSGRRIHQVLRESLQLQAKLETTLQNMSQGIVMVDQLGRIRMWNRQFADLLGLDTDRIAAEESFATVCKRADLPMNIEHQHRVEIARPGDVLLEAIDTPLQNGGHVITYTDISTLKRREDATNQARLDAEQANAAKTRFLAAASHDLRQPMHALGLLFGALSEQVASPATRDLLRQIDDAIEAVDSMLNSLLNISKLDAGVVRPSLGPVHVGVLLKRLDTELQPVAAESGNRLTTRADERLLVESDVGMLERILTNLICNALRYTERGRVLVAARRRGPTVRLEVYDTGPGIPEDQLDEIFVEFHQLGNPERDRRQGLGLGLAIVKRVAGILDHPLEVRSRVGQGSRFCVTVPLLSNRQPIRSVASEGVLSRVSEELVGCRIVVLDDDISVLNAMQCLLERWGCTVLLASNTREALDLVKRDDVHPDLLIVDYRLPQHASGLDAISALRAATHPDMPALLITGDTAPDRLTEAQNSGFPLLHKPVKAAKLRTVLRHLMVDRKSHRATQSTIQA